MTKDPICSMTVDEATALRAERDGKPFYFCSEHCREKFLSQSAPAKPDGVRNGGSVAHVAPTHHSHDSQHFHHDHEDAAVTPSTLNSQPLVAPKPGEGGSTTRTLYTCPMHPEVE